VSFGVVSLIGDEQAIMIDGLLRSTCRQIAMSCTACFAATRPVSGAAIDLSDTRGERPAAACATSTL